MGQITGDTYTEGCLGRKGKHYSSFDGHSLKLFTDVDACLTFCDMLYILSHNGRTPVICALIV